MSDPCLLVIVCVKFLYIPIFLFVQLNTTKFVG